MSSQLFSVVWAVAVVKAPPRLVCQVTQGLMAKGSATAGPVAALEAVAGGAPDGMVWSAGATADNLLAVYDETLARLDPVQVTKIAGKAKSAVAEYNFIRDLGGLCTELPNDEAARALLVRHDAATTRLTITQSERLLCQALQRASSGKTKERLENITANLTASMGNVDWATQVCPALASAVNEVMRAAAPAPASAVPMAALTDS